MSGVDQVTGDRVRSADTVTSTVSQLLPGQQIVVVANTMARFVYPGSRNDVVVCGHGVTSRRGGHHPLQLRVLRRRL